jgi:hypothetical protein
MATWTGLGDNTELFWVVLSQLVLFACMVFLRPSFLIGDLSMSCLWEQLHKSLGTKIIRSSAYRPQTDGQTERVNQILEDMLRACVIHSDN